MAEQSARLTRSAVGFGERFGLLVNAGYTARTSASDAWLHRGATGGRRDPEPPGPMDPARREVLSSATRALHNADGRAASPDPAHHAVADGERRCRPRQRGRARGSISGRRSAAQPTAPLAPDPAPRWIHAIRRQSEDCTSSKDT